MKQSVTLLLLILLATLSQAQQLEVKLSDKHVRKIEKAKKGHARLKRYKKFYSKDSIKLAKQADKYWRDKLKDNAKAIDRENKVEKYKKEFANTVPTKLDSTGIDSLKQEGIEKVKAALPESVELNKGQSELKEMTNGGELSTLKNTDSLKSYASQYTQSKVSALESEAAQIDELKDFESKGEEFEQIRSMPKEYQKQIEQFKQREALKAKSKEMAKEKAVDYFALHAEKLQPIQKKMSLMQNKYSSVLNSNDLSTAVKRSSLKGRPFRERLFIGGNFNMNNLKPLSVDASPQIGYKFNKRFVVGVGGIYRQTFGDTINVTPAIPANSYGYKGFTSYDVIKSFFAYAEYERRTKEVHASASSTNGSITDTPSNKTAWVDGLLIGVGRRMSIHSKVHMNMIVLYNFLYNDENAIYNNPWSFKVGFELSELALLKKK